MRRRHNIISTDTSYEDYLNGDPKRQGRAAAPFFWSVVVFIVASAAFYADRQAQFLPDWLSAHMSLILGAAAFAMVFGFGHMICRLDRDDG